MITQKYGFPKIKTRIGLNLLQITTFILLVTAFDDFNKIRAQAFVSLCRVCGVCHGLYRTLSKPK